LETGFKKVATVPMNSGTTPNPMQIAHPIAAIMPARADGVLVEGEVEMVTGPPDRGPRRSVLASGTRAQG
jgi:hypothetical protein